MNKPETWRKLEPSALEQKLLNAAKADRIPTELGLRVASALSPQSVAPSASAVGPGSVLFSKAGLWGFLSLGLLAGAGAFFNAAGATHVALSGNGATHVALVGNGATHVAPAPPDARPATTAHAALAAPIGAGDSTADHLEPVAVAPSAARAHPEVDGPAATSDGPDALRQEIGLLDRAREALQHGAPQRAFGLLDQHRARFTRGTLVPEAEALRIEALVRLGSLERARRLSRQFLRAYPAHPLRERVGALVEPPPAP